MVEVEATVSDWFYNALLGREVLTISRDYFRLRKPLERRLYETRSETLWTAAGMVYRDWKSSRKNADHALN